MATTYFQTFIDAFEALDQKSRLLGGDDILCPPSEDFGYHFRFNAKTGSTYDRCIDDLARYVLNEGEPWFVRFRDTDALLDFVDSPLQDPEKARLRQALADKGDSAAVSQSLKLLGIQKRVER